MRGNSPEKQARRDARRLDNIRGQVCTVTMADGTATLTDDAGRWVTAFPATDELLVAMEGEAEGRFMFHVDAVGQLNILRRAV